MFVSGLVMPVLMPNALGAVSPGPVDVSASFTLDTTNQRVVIGLLNLLSQDVASGNQNIIGVSQAISGIEFTFGNAGTGITSTFTSLSVSETGGTYLNVTSKTSTTLASPQPANGWQAAVLAPHDAGGSTGTTPPTAYPAVGSGVVTLCTICDPNGMTSNPSQMLISGPSNTTTDVYGSINGSISGGGHQPLLLASGDTYSAGILNGKNSAPVWTVQLPINSLLSTTTITSVTFFFGSQYYEYEAFGDSPEPATFAMMFSGLLLAAWFGRKRLVRKPESSKTF
jgi:hypothetical protein